jgi:phosphoribosylaminoimidazolecarboxamide formyltransferase/IMP cyclohydrolase
LRALISVWDKTGLGDLARGLVSHGYELVASGGTSEALLGERIPHRKVEELTGFPSMLSGRVKTLHPAIHGPILADRANEAHLGELAAWNWEPIDVVVVNLYPFAGDPSVELIDIGGPALVRAAAKNAASVAVVVDPADYPVLLDALASGGPDPALRRRLAAKAFRTVSTYDSMIADWLEEGSVPSVLVLEEVAELRYGENPHQSGALLAPRGPRRGFASASWLGEESPSYLNIFDADGARSLLNELGDEPACVIVKHGGPCGVARAHDPVAAYIAAFEGDPVSAFGGVVALNRPLQLRLAEEMLARPKFDVLVVPSAEEDAVAAIHARRRRARIAIVPDAPRGGSLRTVSGGYLAQPPDELERPEELKLVAGDGPPSPDRLRDAWLAIAVAKAASSNAIAIVRDQSAVGIGQGQPSRVDAARIAVSNAGERAQGAAAASDAFFPFPDGLEVLAEGGVTLVVAPSGSIRDDDIVATADRLGVTLLFSPRRHFRH